MAKSKKDLSTQAKHFLELVKQARERNAGGNFAKAVGKTTLAKQGRKPSKMG